MAQRKKPASGKRRKKSAAVLARPRHAHSRETAIFVFILLGAFSLLGYFRNDGVFIKFLRGLISGLFGGGYYLLSPALFGCAAILALRKDRPAAGKVAAALLVPPVTGAFCQLFSKSVYKLSFSMFRDLWQDGIAVRGGGAVGGAVTVLFEFLFSTAGAAIVLVCAAAALLLVLFSDALKNLIGSMRERAEEQARYEAEHPEQEEARPEQPRVRPDAVRRPAIDIPMDDGSTPQPKPKRPSLFNRKPNAIAPDQLLGGAGVTVPAEAHAQTAPAHSETAAAAPVVPLQPEHPAFAADVTAAAPQVSEPAPTPAPAVRPPEPLHSESPVQKFPAAAPAEPQPVKPAPKLVTDAARSELVQAAPVYRLPPLSLLSLPPAVSKTDGEEELAATKSRLERTLQSFGINTTITNIVHGPAITRYEVELEVGVKLNKLTNLADDIALALGVSGVRIAAIPNRISTVGIEVPNRNVSTVCLREVLASREFRDAKSKLTFAIGKNISGDVIVGNISKLPHLLVAGTTGSGKSVCLNSLILSIMYKSTPDDVRFIMIDPKMVEFKIYNGIPYLLVPVVTEAKKASGALQWAVVEMMKRYRLFSESSARDLPSYNEIMERDGGEKLPQIIIIIDELADLMLVAAKEVEESICRVAQMGRAAGVHLVIATQSPRADVITGLMKANIPSRIAFKVASSLESRIILDAGGAADKLVGNGDMLYAPIGTSKPLRIQGTWVSDTDREKVVEFVKESGEAAYNEEVIDQIERAANSDEEGPSKSEEGDDKSREYDELLPQAVDVIFETKQASVSMLQRRLKLGYARAARIVDQMEEIGVVGPFEGSKPRQILLTRAQWQEMQYGSGTAPADSPLPPEESAEEEPPADDDAPF